MNFDHSFDILCVEKYDTKQEKLVWRGFLKELISTSTWYWHRCTWSENLTLPTILTLVPPDSTVANIDAKTSDIDIHSFSYKSTTLYSHLWNFYLPPCKNLNHVMLA